MSNANSKEKSGAVKSFLSVVFFILIMASALVLAVCMSLRTKSGAVLGVYSGVVGEEIVNFAAGKLCFWSAFSAVVLWFGLWIITTKRIASAIRGLGIGCSIAALGVLLGELISMLLVCVFKLENGLTPYAGTLPEQFADGCGDNVIFLLASIMVASLGVFICKVKKLPKKTKTVLVSESESAPVPVAAAVEHGSENSGVSADVQETSEGLVASLAGVCHMCGKQNDPDVKYCGGCGAKLG